MSFFKIKQRQRLTVIIPPGYNNGLYFFQDLPKLRNTYDEEVITTGVKCFFRPQLDPAGTEEPGPPVMQAAAAKYCQFSLLSEGQLRINNMPVTEVMNAQWGASPVIHQRIMDAFEPMLVDWSKSFVTIAGAPGGAVPAEGAKLVFGVDFIFAPRGTLAEYRNQVRYAQGLALSQF
jgi:hypothetical protein